MMPAVFVGIPCVGWMWSQAVTALLKLRLPPGSSVVHMPGGSAIAAKRNMLADMFLQREDYSHLLFLDSDMTPPPHTVEQLLSHDLPIVGAAMFTRVGPYFVCAGRETPDGGWDSLSDLGGPNPLQRVDWHGTGCLLIRRDALLRTPRPYFDHPPGEPGRGEDSYFCRQATKAGVPIYCDTGLCVGHLGVTSVDVEYVAAWQETPRAQRMLATAPGF